MYESRNDSLLPRAKFARRVAMHVTLAMGLLAGSLALGMAGYMYFEDLEWRDAFLNASMLLGGMGPVDASNMARDSRQVRSRFSEVSVRSFM